MAVVEAPKQLLVPLKVEERLLMGPGPSNAHPRILNACAQPILGLLDPRFCAIMDEVKLGLQYVWQTKNKHTFALSATGHSGIEASIINMTERGEKILICVNGIWGERASDMAERIGKCLLCLLYVFIVNKFIFVVFNCSAALSQSKKISSDLCCFYGGGVSHNEDIMHSFQKFIVVSLPTTLPL